MRHVKQLIYGVFYLALWSGLIAGIYFWKRPAPTCFDGVRNQDEAGVDCGGVCARACIPDAILPVEAAGPARFLPLAVPSGTAPRASIVAEVRNRNANFGATSFEYTFQVFDAAGAVLASFPGRSFIYGSEIKYLVLPNASLPAGAAPASAAVIVGSTQWAPTVRFPRPQIVVQSVATALAPDNGTVVTEGTVVNQDSVRFPTVQITALFRDAAGAVVGTSVTELANVDPGASREFALFHPQIAGLAPDRTDVFVTAANPR